MPQAPALFTIIIREHILIFLKHHGLAMMAIIFRCLREGLNEKKKRFLSGIVRIT